jgi:hypothetical protein
MVFSAARIAKHKHKKGKDFFYQVRHELDTLTRFVRHATKGNKKIPRAIRWRALDALEISITYMNNKYKLIKDLSYYLTLFKQYHPSGRPEIARKL